MDAEPVGGLSDEELAEKLRSQSAAAELPELVVLPSEYRDGRWFYSESHIDAVKIARSAGIDAKFIEMGGEPRFLAEYNAGYVFDLSIAVFSTLSADALIGIGKFVLSLYRLQVRNGLLPADSGELRIRAKVIDRDSEHFHAEDFEAVGTGEDGVRALLKLIGGATSGAEAFQRAVADATDDPAG